MKTAKQYFKESYQNVSEDAILTIPAKNLYRVMEDYAQYKVNELNKSDVIKSVCSCTICGDAIKDGLCAKCREEDENT